MSYRFLGQFRLTCGGEGLENAIICCDVDWQCLAKVSVFLWFPLGGGPGSHSVILGPAVWADNSVQGSARCWQGRGMWYWGLNLGPLHPHTPFSP